MIKFNLIFTVLALIALGCTVINPLALAVAGVIVTFQCAATVIYVTYKIFGG